MKDKRKWWYFATWLVSMIFSLDYFILIRAGDQSMNRRVVFGMFLVISIVSLALFLRELVKKGNPKKYKNDSITQ